MDLRWKKLQVRKLLRKVKRQPPKKSALINPKENLLNRLLLCYSFIINILRDNLGIFFKKAI
jgi:hypothetical protein